MGVELGSAEFWSRTTADPARLAAEVCTIDVANLDRTLQEHAALRAWINASYESAKVEEERARWEVTKARAVALLRCKDVVDPKTKKAKTVSVIEAEADADPVVQEHMERLFNVQERRGALRAMADALEDRRDMLIQIAAKQRQEQRDYT